jgi:hypothetical protein
LTCISLLEIIHHDDDDVDDDDDYEDNNDKLQHATLIFIHFSFAHKHSHTPPINVTYLDNLLTKSLYLRS